MCKTFKLSLFVLFLAPIFLVTSFINGQSTSVLTVISGQDRQITHVLDIEALDKLPQTEIVTTTIWTDGEQKFSGVSLKTLLSHLDVTGDNIEMVALNDYAVTAEKKDLEDTFPIVTTRMNDMTMSVRNKGPFWIIFPYDEDEKYRTEKVYSQSIWQLSQIKVANK